VNNGQEFYADFSGFGEVALSVDEVGEALQGLWMFGVHRQGFSQVEDGFSGARLGLSNLGEANVDFSATRGFFFTEKQQDLLEIVGGGVPFTAGEVKLCRGEQAGDV
jgi:hypothetical protein